MSVNKHPFLCMACTESRTGYNFAADQDRMTKSVEKGVSCMREAAIMEDSFLWLRKLIPKITHGDAELDADDNATEVLLKYESDRDGPKRLPVDVRGNGNCLFNVVSVYLYGNDEAADELRLRTAIELSLHREAFKNSVLSATCRDLDDECIGCHRDGFYSSAWSLSTLATIIDEPILSVYPPGMEFWIYITFSGLNNVFYPIGSPNQLWISGLCSHVGRGRENNVNSRWQPNHFVPLMPTRHVRVNETQKEPIRRLDRLSARKSTIIQKCKALNGHWRYCSQTLPLTPSINSNGQSSPAGSTWMDTGDMSPVIGNESSEFPETVDDMNESTTRDEEEGTSSDPVIYITSNTRAPHWTRMLS